MNCETPARIKITRAMQSASSIKRASLVPCGRCLNCRTNQARVWTNRILLEQNMHGNSCFLTLTYSDEHLPDPPHVFKSEIQNYIKRLRYYVKKPFRYYAVGEYGSKSFRPHYHACLFGVDGILHEQSIRNSWQGRSEPVGIHIGELNPSTARYITGYIANKARDINNRWINREHPEKYGKAPEFMISSKGGGGIGIKAALHVIKVIQNQKFDLDRIRELRVGRKKYPLGRYLENKINGTKPWERRLLDFRAMQESLYEQTRKIIKQTKYKTDRRPL